MEIIKLFKIDVICFKEWTLLDCCFGIPLFDADANTHICDAIVQRLQSDEKYVIFISF